MEIYHNPRCSKSRQTLAILVERGQQPNIIEYLKEVPSKEELKQLLGKLGLAPQDILRKGEVVFKEKYKGKQLSDDQWLDAMVEYPKLIERPIVVNGDKAVLGRPPENVLTLF